MIDDFSHAGFVRVTDRCVYSAFVGSRCQRCKDVCMVGAIRMGRAVTIDKGKCIHCGLCYAACEGSAIEIKTDNYRMLVQLSEMEEVEVGCIFSDAAVHVFCLSRLTDDLIVSWAVTKRKVIIKKGKCEKCRFGKTLSVFDEHLKRAKSVLFSMGKGLENVLIVESLSDEPHIPKNTVSRRFIFSKKLVTPHKPKRDIMIEAVDDALGKVVEYGAIYRLKVKGGCDMCGACVNSCTQGALIMRKKENSAAIYFNPSLCTACDSCVDVCLNEAISKEVGVTLDLKPKAVKLVELEKRICVLCSREFYSNREEKLCPVCEQGKRRKERLREFFKEFLEHEESGGVHEWISEE